MKRMFQVTGMVAAMLLAAGQTAGAEAGAMTPGTYSETVDSMKGKMTVTVTVDENSIKDIQLDTVDTAHIVGAVQTQMIPEILEAQSLKVDSVSGATVSSAAVKYGVRLALEEAGADTSVSFNADATVVPAEKEVEEAAVVVVGSGGAGLSTAIMLAENGVGHVILLEKQGFFGGTTSVSGGGVWAVGDTKFNQNTGFDYDADGLLKHIYEASGAEEGALNEGLIRNIADVSAEVFNYYLDDVGVPFDIETVDFGDSLSEMPVAWTDGAGGVLISHLVERAQNLGVDLRLNSKVDSLLVEDGAVTGVHVAGREAIYDIHSSKVVLATGGFQRNKELVEELTPDYVNAVPFTSAGSTGDGITMARELGAVVSGNTLAGLGGLGEQFGYEDLGSSIWGSAIFVNKNGDRYIDETAHYSYHLDAIMEQPDGKVFGIGDSTSSVYENIAQLVELRYAVTADTIEELAELIEVDPAELQKTVDTYTADLEAGNDDSVFGTANANMKSLSQAPYFALKMDGVSFAGLAGLVVDDTCHILNADNEVIPNLYGAGELVGSNILQGRYAGSGSQVGPSLYEGKIIADAIAAELK
ncbi:MAG: FAD-dependent oxidoreductase [Eubacteriales bacterium]|nr:FAD-dependent oxidoreductase [Eubacteriales bacterium]